VKFIRLIQDLEQKGPSEAWGLTLFETVRTANATLLLKAVEAIEAVCKMDTRSILS
jgi:hypothetical protein